MPSDAEMCRKGIEDGCLILPHAVPSEVIDASWVAYEAAIKRGAMALEAEAVSPEDNFAAAGLRSARQLTRPLGKMCVVAHFGAGNAPAGGCTSSLLRVSPIRVRSYRRAEAFHRRRTERAAAAA